MRHTGLLLLLAVSSCKGEEGALPKLPDVGYGERAPATTSGAP